MMNRVNDVKVSEFLDRALEETMDLLAAASFNTLRGGYEQGELAAISLLISSAEVAGTTRLQVMCHDPGHLGIDWDGIPLILIDRVSGEERIGFLDRRGRAEFVTSIPPANELGFEPIAPKCFAMVDVPEQLLTGSFSSAATKPLWSVTGGSPDGTLSAVAERVGRGELRISVRANVPEMRNAIVRIVLRSKRTASDIWLNKKITLKQKEGMEGHWRGQIGTELRGRSGDALLLVLPSRGRRG